MKSFALTTLFAVLAAAAPTPAPAPKPVMASDVAAKDVNEPEARQLFGIPAGTGTGTIPGIGSGAVPGLGSGAVPGLGSGAVPGLGSGAVPGLGSGAVPGLGSGAVPGLGSGAVPGLGSGAVPGLGSGAVPGMGSGMGMERNDLENGQAPCPKAIFIFARGSTEPGNMGASVGPLVANALTSHFGQNGVWIQGVGGPYTAGLVENAMPEGSSPAAIAEMNRLFTMAHQKCPKTNILAGGYSQGAALAAAAVSSASAAVRKQIIGVVLFGYTKNLQNNGKIPNFPADRVKVFCNQGDMVCTGSLVITAAHLAYAADASNAAPQFLESKVAALTSSSSSSESQETTNASSDAD